MSLDPEILAYLRAEIARRLTPKPVKVRADIEVKCFSYAGIEAIRKALQAGEATSTEQVPIKVRLVAPPLYVMSTTSTDKVIAMQLMEKAVEAIGEKIAEERGELVIKMKVRRDVLVLRSKSVLTHDLQPTIVSETDDAELKALMEKIERANMDVSGDEDSEEEEA